MASKKSRFVEYKNGEGVWKHFLRATDGQSTRCKLCLPKEMIIKTTGGSTTGLHTHLKTKHTINLLKTKRDEPVAEGEDNESFARPNHLNRLVHRQVQL